MESYVHEKTRTDVDVFLMDSKPEGTPYSDTPRDGLTYYNSERWFKTLRGCKRALTNELMEAHRCKTCEAPHAMIYEFKSEGKTFFDYTIGFRNV